MDGGQGRIRTSVARKERQIYSLLPLAARPPVQEQQNQTTTATRYGHANAVIPDLPGTLRVPYRVSPPQAKQAITRSTFDKLQEPDMIKSEDFVGEEWA